MPQWTVVAKPVDRDEIYGTTKIDAETQEEAELLYRDSLRSTYRGEIDEELVFRAYLLEKKAIHTRPKKLHRRRAA